MEYKTYENDSVTPSLNAPFFAEHLARYRFAQQFIQDKTVLELGCGKGYGAFVLAQVAKSVVACDLNADSLAFAKKHYAAKNLEYKKENVTESGIFHKFDVAVSFEVIEHLSADETLAYLRVAKSCLVPGGLFLLSTPNHDVVVKSGMPVPDFHINNLTSLELRKLLKNEFSEVQMWGQIFNQGLLKNTLYYLDYFNLRHSLISKRFRTNNNVEMPKPVTDVNFWNISQGFGAADNYIFSKLLWRQAGMCLAICS